MAKIAVDIDDTLYSFGDVAKDAIFRMAHARGDLTLLQGAYVPATQWRIPTDTLGEKVWMEAIELSHRPEVIASQEPYPGAAETLNALHDEGHELIYISNRDETAAEATHDWLIDRGFPLGIARTEIKCLWGDKLPYLSECQYLIDDRPNTIIRFVFDFEWHDKTNGYPSLARRAFSLSKPYNENLTDVDHIYLAPSWAALNHYFVGKGLLDEPAYEALGLLGEEVSLNGRGNSTGEAN